MNFVIKVAPDFLIEAKRLKKRHRSFIEDLESFKQSLLDNPLQGVELCPGIRKIRMAITSKGRGKSGGVRVITANAIITQEKGCIGLLYVYDKADASNIRIDVMKQIARDLGFDV